MMERNYSVGLEYQPRERYLIEFWEAESYLRNSLSLKAIAKGDNALSIQTIDGKFAYFACGEFSITFTGSLEKACILDSIRYTVEIAMGFEKLRFNPNLVYLTLEGFDSEEHFVSEFSPTAIELENRLYGGGRIGYYESKNSFIAFLGVEHDMERYADVELRKIESNGRAISVESLDGLLRQINQS